MDIVSIAVVVIVLAVVFVFLQRMRAAKKHKDYLNSQPRSTVNNPRPPRDKRPPDEL